MSSEILTLFDAVSASVKLMSFVSLQAITEIENTATRKILLIIVVGDFELKPKDNFLEL
ncbi:hypothetical protein GCM10011444_21480 [Winogradskyella haliclonae]|uniref:Uncharacterized protein n=1 Tax=Winogradskyella haliclonae TaxID=2048558 RepID=A0ABQ2C049_9FLAO|nr:hypothetical protein GCM10011444_21480 [Winogradskyella haliclonae]